MKTKPDSWRFSVRRARGSGYNLGCRIFFLSFPWEWDAIPGSSQNMTVEDLAQPAFTRPTMSYDWIK